LADLVAEHGAGRGDGGIVRGALRREGVLGRGGGRGDDGCGEDARGEETAAHGDPPGWSVAAYGDARKRRPGGKAARRGSASVRAPCRTDGRRVAGTGGNLRARPGVGQRPPCLACWPGRGGQGRAPAGRWTAMPAPAGAPPGR